MMAVLQSPRAYFSPTEILLGVSGKNPSPIPAMSMAQWSRGSRSKTLLSGPANAGRLTDPMVGPLADVVIPFAIRVEVGTVLTSTQPVPLPVIWLSRLPVPGGEGQEQVGKVSWNRVGAGEKRL